MTVNGTAVDGEIFRYYYDLACTDGSLTSRDARVQAATESCIRYVAVNSTFRAWGLSLTGAERALCAERANALWRAFSAHYGRIGVSKETFLKIRLSGTYLENMRYALFDRGGMRPDQDVMSANWDETGYFHMGSQPWLKVNMRGERFSNESQPYDFILHAGFMQPGHMYSTIYDSEWMRHVTQFHQIGCARIAPSESGGKLQIFSPELEARILGMLEARGIVQRADTLEELAVKLHLPVDTFVSTVNRYNELCEKGVDEDFGKEAYRMIPLKTAPFFGCRQGASLLCTLDGLRINEKMQVLDQEGEPIEGLYAAGDCSGSFFAHNYPEYVVGVAVGRSLTEGYVVGEALGRM